MGADRTAPLRRLSGRHSPASRAAAGQPPVRSRPAARRARNNERRTILRHPTNRTTARSHPSCHNAPSRGTQRPEREQAVAWRCSRAADPPDDARAVRTGGADSSASYATLADFAPLVAEARRRFGCAVVVQHGALAVCGAWLLAARTNWARWTRGGVLPAGAVLCRRHRRGHEPVRAACHPALTLQEIAMELHAVGARALLALEGHARTEELCALAREQGLLALRATARRRPHWPLTSPSRSARSDHQPLRSLFTV